MEYTKNIEECGCRINRAYNEKPFIDYCLLHKAAPDMEEALKHILKNLDDGFANKNLSLKTMIKQVLAKAIRR